MKFFIINGYSWANKGDFAIRLGMICALHQTFGNKCKIRIASSTPEIDSEKYTQNGVNIVDFRFLINSHKGFIKIFHALYKYSLVLADVIVYRLSGKKRVGSILNSYLWADVVLSPGGGFLNDNYILSGLLPNLFQIYISILCKKPFVIYAQSIGPFHNSFFSMITAKILNKALTITLREEISKTWVEKMGVSKPKIFVTADAAFSLQIPNKKFDISNYIGNNIEENSFIGITPVNWSFPKCLYPYIQYDKYIDALTKSIQYITEEKGLNVVMIPQVTDVYNVGFGGDKKPLNDILRKLPNKKGVFVLEDDYTPHQLIEIYGTMKFLIGSRMHSNIFALLSSTPCIAISYEHKTEGIMRQLGVEDWVIPICNIDFNKIKVKIDKMLSHYIDERELIKKKIILIKNKSQRNADLLLKKYKQ